MSRVSQYLRYQAGHGPKLYKEPIRQRIWNHRRSIAAWTTIGFLFLMLFGQTHNLEQAQKQLDPNHAYASNNRLTREAKDSESNYEKIVLRFTDPARVIRVNRLYQVKDKDGDTVCAIKNGAFRVKSFLTYDETQVVVVYNSTDTDSYPPCKVGYEFDENFRIVLAIATDHWLDTLQERRYYEEMFRPLDSR